MQKLSGVNTFELVESDLPYYQNLKRSASALVKDSGLFLRPMVDFMKSLSLTIPAVLGQLVVGFSRYTRQFFASRGLSREEYVHFLDALFDKGVVSNENTTTFFCIPCFDDNVIVPFGPKLRPSEIELKCPRCHRHMGWSTFYTFDPLVGDAFLNKDGMLFIGVAMYLADKGRSFVLNAADGVTEYDILVDIGQEKVLIETKTSKTFKDDETKIANLNKLVGEAINHANQLRATGKQLKRVLALSNYFEADHKQLFTRVLDMNASKTASVPITLCGPDTLRSALEVLDKTS